MGIVWQEIRIVGYPDLNPCHLFRNMEIMIQTLDTVSLGVWCHSKCHVVPYHRRTETSIFTTVNMSCVVPLLLQTAIHLDLPAHITCCSSSERGIRCPFTITNHLHLCQFCRYILSVADLGSFLSITHMKLYIHIFISYSIFST